MLALLKFLGIVGTAVFGLFGSLTDCRDKNGKITNQGWIALVGLVVCATFVGAVEIYSDQRSDKNMVQIIDDNKKLLSDVNRSLHPLPGLASTYYLRPDWQHPKFKLLFDKLKKNLNYGPIFESKGLQVGHSGFGGGQFQEITEDQTFEDSVCEITPVIFFFKNPIDPNKFKYGGIDRSVGENLRIRLGNPCLRVRMSRQIDKMMEKSQGKANEQRPAPNENRYSMEWKKKDGQVVFFDMEVPDVQVSPTSDSWFSDSEISSVFDLVGAQMIVQLTSSGGYRWTLEHSTDEMEAIRKETDALRASVTLSGLILRFPDGIALSFDNENLSEYVGAHGLKFYAYRFPNNFAKILTGAKYDRFKRCCKGLE